MRLYWSVGLKRLSWEELKTEHKKIRSYYCCNICKLWGSECHGGWSCEEMSKIYGPIVLITISARSVQIIRHCIDGCSFFLYFKMEDISKASIMRVQGVCTMSGYKCYSDGETLAFTKGGA